jgi:transcriptional regulator with XRE-family HTH domain
MRLARNKDKVLAAQPPSLNAAQRLLLGAPDSRVDKDLREDARRLRSEGLTYDDIAERLGVTRDSAYRWCNPKVEERRRRQIAAQSMAGRRALNKQKRESDVRKAGGSLAVAYSHLRKALQALDKAASEHENRDVRAAISSATLRAHNVEDEIVKAARAARAH